jgi:hypothetical protein
MIQNVIYVQFCTKIQLKCNIWQFKIFWEDLHLNTARGLEPLSPLVPLQICWLVSTPFRPQNYDTITNTFNNIWLIDYLRFYVPLKNISLIWIRHHCRWRAAKFRPMLGAKGLWAGRYLYRATPAVTRDLGFSGLIRRTTPFSRLLGHTRGCGGSILTRILTGPFDNIIFNFHTVNISIELIHLNFHCVMHTDGMFWPFIVGCSDTSS